MSPYSLFTAGFQLTFAAVAGLICFIEPLNIIPRRLKLLRRIASVFIIPIAVSIATFPILAVWFGGFTVASIPISACASIFFPVFMLCGAVAVICWYCGYAATAFCGMTDAFADLFDSFINRVSPLSTASFLEVDFGVLSVCALVAAAVALGTLFHISGIKAKTLAGTICVLSLLCVGCEEPPRPMVLVDGNEFSTVLYASMPEAGYAIALEGRPYVNPRFRRFLLANGADTIVEGTAGAGVEKRYRLFFIGGKYEGDIEQDILSLPERYTVILSAGVSDSIVQRAGACCRSRRIPLTNLAKKVYFATE